MAHHVFQPGVALRCGKRIAAAWLATMVVAGKISAAALEWSVTEISARASLGQGTFEAAYPFENNGSAPVTIRRVESSCDCTVAIPAAVTIGPGQSSHIRAVLTIGERTGLLQQTLVVHTDEPGAAPVKLTLAVEVPEPVIFEPRFVLWPVDSEPAPRIVNVTVAAGAGFVIKRAACDTPGFGVAIEPIKPGASYRVRITPASTAAPARAVVRLETEPASPRGLTLIAQIR